LQNAINCHENHSGLSRATTKYARSPSAIRLAITYNKFISVSSLNPFAQANKAPGECEERNYQPNKHNIHEPIPFYREELTGKKKVSRATLVLASGATRKMPLCGAFPILCNMPIVIDCQSVGLRV
jgi:hypothetical protein